MVQKIITDVQGDTGKCYLEFGLRNFSDRDKQKIFDTCLSFFSSRPLFSVD